MGHDDRFLFNNPRVMSGIMGNEVSTCQMHLDDLKPQKEDHRI
jgi:hypothetical protein